MAPADDYYPESSRTGKHSLSYQYPTYPEPRTLQYSYNNLGMAQTSFLLFPFFFGFPFFPFFGLPFYRRGFYGRRFFW
ncbi:hypothetical protein [Mechercharimyces sp. CAU 1602]|uniref:hypothetical protein n=1 Tax=Mechercharimyces sp. CAU 1602 TaxID=2973933 RepID=UPI00216167C4|nr:hypothetical protein [Mechercharimyces sp. CAU 1602]MCS1351023.1 hypothetical protein [Mechercharimyces sp. CAU 1602]